MLLPPLGLAPAHRSSIVATALRVWLLCVTSFGAAGYAAALFTEDFNAEVSVKGRHRQARNGLPIKYGSGVMPGWTRQGAGMPSHFVERAPGDWALMVVAKTAGQNVFTLNKGLPPDCLTNWRLCPANAYRECLSSCPSGRPGGRRWDSPWNLPTHQQSAPTDRPCCRFRPSCSRSVPAEQISGHSVPAGRVLRCRSLTSRSSGTADRWRR